jgi:catechol 2,3-dioxygenase-like lactoylglutathione lyase family enzyme
MSARVAGTEMARPFLPSKDLALSTRFYETLGFEPLLRADDVAIFRVGRGEFLLQARYVKDWAENAMMQLMVDDLDQWWRDIQALDLPGQFGVAPPKAPAMQPWGLRVAYVVDPAGVLWHVGQRRPNTAHD